MSVDVPRVFTIVGIFAAFGPSYSRGKRFTPYAFEREVLAMSM